MGEIPKSVLARRFYATVYKAMSRKVEHETGPWSIFYLPDEQVYQVWQRGVDLEGGIEVEPYVMREKYKRFLSRHPLTHRLEMPSIIDFVNRCLEAYGEDVPTGG